MARGFPYTDLKEFLAALDQAGELHRVSVPVDPTLEISEIVTRTVAARGPARQTPRTCVRAPADDRCRRAEV